MPWGAGGAVLIRGIQEGLRDKVTFEQRPECDKN